MSVKGINEITSRFKERWLSPLQFPGSHRSVEQRLTDLESGKSGQKPSSPRAKTRVKGQKSQAPAPQASPAVREEVKRVGEDHASDSYAWHAEHSGAASDLLHTFNQRMDSIQAQKKPSQSGGWAAYNDTFGSGAKSTASPAAPAAAPLNTPAAPAAPKPQRVTQPGLFGPSQVAPVRSPQQFGLAAKSKPLNTQAAPGGPSAPRKPRVTQPGLFPKSAVKPPQ
jgi:hypothetical protein